MFNINCMLTCLNHYLHWSQNIISFKWGEWVLACKRVKKNPMILEHCSSIWFWHQHTNQAQSRLLTVTPPSQTVTCMGYENDKWEHRCTISSPSVIRSATGGSIDWHIFYKDSVFVITFQRAICMCFLLLRDDM